MPEAYCSNINGAARKNRTTDEDALQEDITRTIHRQPPCLIVLSARTGRGTRFLAPGEVGNPLGLQGTTGTPAARRTVARLRTPQARGTHLADHLEAGSREGRLGVCSRTRQVPAAHSRHRSSELKMGRTVDHLAAHMN